VGSNPTSSAIHFATHISAVAIQSSDAQPLSRFPCLIAQTEGSNQVDKSDETPRGRGFIVGMMLFAALLILAYWLIWFLVDRDLLASLHTDYYYHFENAFPAADVWLGAMLILGAVGLLLRRPWGLLAGLLGGGGVTMHQPAIDVVISHGVPFLSSAAINSRLLAP
jgi:hypothetical protein